MSSPPSRLLQKWLRIDPAARPRIYRQVYVDADLSSVAYWLETLLSAGIASLGLVLNSPAVIIGAMLISPLMAPIMATGLGLAAGDLFLIAKALFKLIASIAVATALSALLVWLLPFHSPTSEILARTNPTLLDLGIALLSGIAGSVAVSRSVGSTDGVTTVPGVAIAVALMPPLCTVGFGIGSGMRTGVVRGAGLLFITNIVAIVFSAFLIFLFIGINSEEVRYEMQRCRETEPLAQRLSRGAFAALMRDGGQLRWRVLLLSLLLTAVAWPLQLALRQLTGEARTREIVERQIRALVPATHLVSEQIEVGQHTVAVRVVTTQSIPLGAIKRAEAEIASEAQRQASVSVESVASQSELAKLVQRLDQEAVASAQPVPAPPPPPPTPPALQGDQLREKMQTVLAATWPPDYPIQDDDIVLGPDGTTLRVRYLSRRSLPPVAVRLLTATLQGELAMPKLVLTPVRVAPPRHRGARRR